MRRAPLALSLLLLAACGTSAATDAGDGGADAGPSDAGAASVTFRLSLEAGAAAPVYVQASTAEGPQAWLSILDPAGEVLSIHPRCDLCSCDHCECPVCGVGLSTVTEVDAGGSVEWVWDARLRPVGTCDGTGQSCWEETPASAGAYLARFCWGTSVEERAPDAFVAGERCEDVPFDLPVEGGVVSYTVPAQG